MIELCWPQRVPACHETFVPQNCRLSHCGSEQFSGAKVLRILRHNKGNKEIKFLQLLWDYAMTLILKLILRLYEYVFIQKLRIRIRLGQTHKPLR